MYHILLMILVIATSASSDRPNIVFILADDLGWNDVGFHGSNQIPTPNIDALAYSGVILNNYYVAPMCTPSRAALMTGKHPIHLGLQHSVLMATEARGLPLKEKLLPEYLKEIGYSTHAVGKWHLGYYKKEYTPTYRGFDTFLGYWTAKQDYYDHTLMETGGSFGLDMRRGLEVERDLHGVYSTDAFTTEAVSIIEKHNTSSPLFLYLSHLAVHSGNSYNYLAAPDELVSQFDYITNFPRRKFAAMLTKLDESVGIVVEALKEKGILSNTIIVFSTDNGGSANGIDASAGSNWPLRGVKYLLWEGGIRGNGLIWTSSMKPGVSQEKMYMTDWLPTLLSAANYSKEIVDIDGVNAWDSIVNGSPAKRNEILHNIDDIEGVASLTAGDYKIIKGMHWQNWNDWYGPSGRESNLKYNVDAVISSPAGQAITSTGKSLKLEKIMKLRSEATVVCNNKGDMQVINYCNPAESPCLFNIREDPCELNNLASVYPTVLENLERTLEKYNATAISASNQPRHPDANPKFWNYTWHNFGDYPSPTNSTIDETQQEITLPQIRKCIDFFCPKRKS